MWRLLFHAVTYVLTPLNPRAHDRPLPPSPASSSRADAIAQRLTSQRRERSPSGEELCPHPVAGHTGAPTGQADQGNGLQYQQRLLPPVGGRTKPQGSVGLSPLFGTASVALLLFCQAQQFLWGPRAAPGFVRSAFSHPSSRNAQQRQAGRHTARHKSSQLSTEEGLSRQQPRHRGSPGLHRVHPAREDAVTKGRAVALNAPQPACVNAVKQSPCALHQTQTVPPSCLPLREAAFTRAGCTTAGCEL